MAREVSSAFERDVERLMNDLAFEKVRDALVLALAVDGYIDIEAMDAEQFLHGDASAYERTMIERAAKSLHRFLVMEPAEIEALRLEVLNRRWSDEE